MDRDSSAPTEQLDVDSLPKTTRDRLGEWNGILWLDYMNSDGASARAHLDAERQEIEELEKEEQERRAAKPLPDAQKNPQTKTLPDGS